MSNTAHSFQARPTEILLNKVSELPTLPTIIYELSRLINNPMSSTKSIEQVMVKDQSLTTKVLKLANSAYYAIPGGVTTVARAIGFLGFDTVNQIVLSTSIIKAFKGPAGVKFDINQLWQHAIGVAMASETIGKFIRYQKSPDLFTCGLVHDMGKVILCQVDPELLGVIIQTAAENKSTFLEAERKLKTTTHMQLGAILAKRWQLPMAIQSCIAFHHEESPERRSGLSAELGKSVDIVYLANILIHELHFGNSGHDKVVAAPNEILERLGIKADQMPELMKKIEEHLEQAESFLNIIQST